MKGSKVTITDLAKSLDLSLCTVSKILNRSFDGFSYAPETVTRVEAAAKKMGYRPNPQAQSLRTRKSKLIGFVLPTAEIALFGALTDRLELEFRQRGYHVLIAHTRHDSKEEASLVAELLARGVDGLVWVPAVEKVDADKVGVGRTFPAVIVDRVGCTASIPSVATANREAAEALARRAFEAGHRQVVVLNAPANDRTMVERCEGIKAVFPKCAVLDTLNEIHSARKATAELLARNVKATLLVTLSEPLSIGALATLRDLEVSLPDSLSFAGFDDFPLAAHWSPRLTVIRQDVAALACAATNLLLARLKNPRKKFGDIRVPASIEWRESILPLGIGAAAVAGR